MNNDSVDATGNMYAMETKQNSVVLTVFTLAMSITGTLVRVLIEVLKIPRSTVSRLGARGYSEKSPLISGAASLRELPSVLCVVSAVEGCSESSVAGASLLRVDGKAESKRRVGGLC